MSIAYIYTDGSCLNNPGYGAHGFIAIDESGEEIQRYLCFGGVDSTNNKEELSAILAALRSFANDPTRKWQKLIIYSDSKYAINCITKWIHGWKRNNWITSNKSEVKNKDILEDIDEELQTCKRKKISVDFTWVKAHDTNVYNNTIDVAVRDLATSYKEKHEKQQKRS